MHRPTLIRITVATATLLAAVAVWQIQRPRDWTVMIAYGDGEPSDALAASETYRTTALRINQTRAEPIGEVSDVIVPVDAGFERLWILQTCSTDSALHAVNYGQSVRRASALSARDSVTRNTCRPTRADSTIDCDDYRARILFATSRFHAVEMSYQQTSDCEPRGGHWTRSTHMYRGTDTLPISLHAIWDSTVAFPAHQEALVHGMNWLKREGFNCPEPTDYDTLSWGIKHERGRWSPLVTVNDFGIHGECQFSFAVDLSIPDSIIGAAALGGAVPDGVTFDNPDFLVSPDGHFVIGIAGQYENVRLVVYRVTRNTLVQLMNVPWNARNAIVAAHWARGRAAARWGAFFARR